MSPQDEAYREKRNRLRYMENIILASWLAFVVGLGVTSFVLSH